RNNVLRQWIEKGSPPWPGATAAAADGAAVPIPEESELWFDVRDIFVRRCMKCHEGANPQSERPLLQVGDYASLTRKRVKQDRQVEWFPWPEGDGDAWYYVKPGEPGEAALKESLLYRRVKADEMPPSAEKTTPAEKAILKVWIEAGAPVPAAPARGPTF